MVRKYLTYIIRHKWLVLIESVRLGVPLLGLLHDLSKLTLAEFMPYARKFYGGDAPDAAQVARMAHAGQASPFWTEQRVKEAFDHAWLAHQKRNKHHYQAWVLIKDDGSVKPLEMPVRYIKAMLADWLAMSRAFTGKREKVVNWYTENMTKVRLHPRTRATVEYMIGVESTLVTRDPIAWATMCNLTDGDSHVGIARLF